ncbi:MAG: methyltransferase domain-containing protein, partial [Anaerolineae bacterium]|nr:methyltransferase domain-containing protein [Anaerolineae bacterium]
MIDYGAGDGWWSHSFKQIGSEHAYAVELDDIAFEHTPADVIWKRHDLREPLNDLVGTFDLVMCLEVAEHIPKHQAHNHLLATLTKSTGSILIFSAAQPGQPGTGHI